MVAIRAAHSEWQAVAVVDSRPRASHPLHETPPHHHHHHRHPQHHARAPLELAKAISDEVSAPSDLRALRAASKWWHAEVTPRAFHTITIRDTVHSATGLANILQDAALSPYVREIVYQDPKADSEGKLTESARPNKLPRQGYDRDIIPDDAIDALGAAFALTDRAPALETVTLIFYPVYFEVFPWDILSPSSQLRAQRAILGGLARAASAGLKLHTLTLLNLLAQHSPVFDEPAFAALLAPLRAVRIDVLASDIHEGDYPEEDFAEFWETSMTHRLLPPAGPDAPLEALTIRSEEDVGLVPGFSFADRTYPRLAALSVKSIMFGATVGVEELIVRHAGTLRRLVIESSMIGIEEDEEEPPQFWAAIWDRFRETLVGLEELVVREDRDETGDGRVLNYGHFDPGWGYIANFEGTEGEEGDGPALQAFVDAVEARRGQRAQESD
ncbi:hypothetical protein EVG20_g8991 [Dentipellis fragilis]|uniref:F-box domain-containing protein n=1 Tax=Dentipellis fragilis TaxID=205917 RepID=A0A4Y9Y3X4_9AGAM|nr:hypothetical protein EVG20_g8991 [Dentipellis fragilis]